MATLIKDRFGCTERLKVHFLNLEYKMPRINKRIVYLYGYLLFSMFRSVQPISILFE